MLDLRDDHFFDDMSLFALECKVFLSHVCAVNAELDVPVQG